MHKNASFCKKGVFIKGLQQKYTFSQMSTLTGQRCAHNNHHSGYKMLFHPPIREQSLKEHSTINTALTHCVYQSYFFGHFLGLVVKSHLCILGRKTVKNGFAAKSTVLQSHFNWPCHDPLAHSTQYTRCIHFTIPSYRQYMGLYGRCRLTESDRNTCFPKTTQKEII